MQKRLTRFVVMFAALLVAAQAFAQYTVVMRDGTRYKAIAIHGNDEARKKHEEMGFHDGWGTVVSQMVEYIKAGRMQS